MQNKPRIRSYICHGRPTQGQKKAYQALWQSYGIAHSGEILSLKELFGRDTPTFLEIGFGTGISLAAAAKKFPEINFIGVETHKPGVGALCLQVKQLELLNIRIYHGDVIDLLEKNLLAESLSGVAIFFPDPWQKRRHHARRLIQQEFLNLLASKMQPHAELHLATDWEDYATHMLKVLSASDKFHNLTENFSERSYLRPVISKFEKRAIAQGRSIRELQFSRHNPSSPLI